MDIRPLRALALACALVAFALAGAAPALARGTSAQPLSFVRSQGTPQSPVEQQTPGWYGVDCPPGPGACQPDQSQWVVNPTSCPWDIDDYLSEVSVSGSYLDAGRSASVTDCLIADNAHHVVGVTLTAPSSALTATLAYEPFGLSVPIPVVSASSKQYTYQACVIGPYGMSDLPPVEGSNGGVGIPTAITLTVANSSGRTVKNIGAYLRLWSATTTNVNSYCPAAPAVVSAAGALWKIAP